MTNQVERMKLVNLTPHEVVILDSNDNIIAKIPPSGTVARVESGEELISVINGIPVYKVSYGNIQGLPEPEPGTVYIVSIVVLSALKEKGINRKDVVAPNTNPSKHGAVRDPSGKIVGVKSFIVL
jgi:hypothetical protein